MVDRFLPGARLTGGRAVTKSKKTGCLTPLPRVHGSRLVSVNAAARSATPGTLRAPRLCIARPSPAPHALAVSMLDTLAPDRGIAAHPSRQLHGIPSPDVLLHRVVLRVKRRDSNPLPAINSR